MHALHYVEKASGGRGKKGGLSEYAERVGRHAGNLGTYRQAAAVAETLLTLEGFSVSAYLDKAAHLAAIHKLPEEAWGVDLELGNKKDLLEIGKAKRQETEGRPSKEKLLSQNDNSNPTPKHNTRVEIAKAAGVSTGQVGVGGRPKQRQEPEPVEPQQKIVAVSRPYYAAQAKIRMEAGENQHTKRPEEKIPQGKARDEAGKAVRCVDSTAEHDLS